MGRGRCSDRVFTLAEGRLLSVTCSTGATPSMSIRRSIAVTTGVSDHALLQDIWDHNPLLRQYLGDLDNPELIVYRVRPLRVRYMKEWALSYEEVPIEPAHD